MSKTRNQKEAIKLLEGLISHIGSGNIEGKQLERLLYLLHYLLEEGGTLSDGRLDFITKLLENEKILSGNRLEFITQQEEEIRKGQSRDIPYENQEKK